MRWVGYGGAPIASVLVSQIKAAFPDARVINGFGMTETASLMTVLPDGEAVDHADSVGYCVPSVELAVDPVGDDGAGELLARGANVTTGYWQRDDATAAAFVDGWLRTGDIVRVDEPAACTSSTAPRTSSSAAARTSPASRWRTRSPGLPASPRPP